MYAQGHAHGFEIRDRHLETLVAGPGSRLRKLVLLGCSRLTSSVITTCLQSLPILEYFAISIVTVTELRSNFVLALPRTVSIIKIQITHAWYSVPLIGEELEICDALEVAVMNRRPPPEEIYIRMHSEAINHGGRAEKWNAIAAEKKIILKIGPWEDEENM